MMNESSRKEIVQEYYSAKADYWASLYHASQRWLPSELAHREKMVLDLIAECAQAGVHTILDIGCGAGNYLAKISGNGFECTGVDSSKKMLDLARKEIDRAGSSTVKLIEADCCQIPLADHSFDLILAIGLFEYLGCDSAAAREINRLLNSKGRAVVTFPNRYKLRSLLNPYYYLVRGWSYFFDRRATAAKKKDPEHFDYGKSISTRYSLPGAKKILRQAGFDILDVRSCCFGPFSLWEPLHSPGTSMRTSNFIEKLQKMRLFRFLGFFANRWVFLIQPSASKKEDGR